MIDAQTSEAIRDFYDAQFACWPAVRENYLALGKTERRVFIPEGSPLPIILQHNPGRVRSTEARTDAASIAARPCFLCTANRPGQQIVDNGTLPGWEILINPYPIFPIHFTVASSTHVPQEKMPLAMMEFADIFSGLAAFFNGSASGASAPDHLHFQAINADELPLLKLLESQDTPVATPEIPGFPPFWSLRITPDATGMALMAQLPEMCGTDLSMSNSFIWKDSRGYLRALVFPRTAHRPRRFFAEGEQRLGISPGAIDMAGVIIVPSKADFDKVTEEEIREIYADVAPDSETFGKMHKRYFRV